MRVCIFGSGLSALTLAKALVNQNIYVDLYSQKKIILPDNLRTIGISKSNVEFFNHSIINVDKISWKLKKIEIFSDNLRKEKLINYFGRSTTCCDRLPLHFSMHVPADLLTLSNNAVA